MSYAITREEVHKLDAIYAEVKRNHVELCQLMMLLHGAGLESSKLEAITADLVSALDEFRNVMDAIGGP